MRWSEANDSIEDIWDAIYETEWESAGDFVNGEFLVLGNILFEFEMAGSFAYESLHGYVDRINESDGYKDLDELHDKLDLGKPDIMVVQNIY